MSKMVDFYEYFEDEVQFQFVVVVTLQRVSKLTSFRDSILRMQLIEGLDESLKNKTKKERISN